MKVYLCMYVAVAIGGSRCVTTNLSRFVHGQPADLIKSLESLLRMRMRKQGSKAKHGKGSGSS